jgi:hypothetical protein
MAGFFYRAMLSMGPAPGFLPGRGGFLLCRLCCPLTPAENKNRGKVSKMEQNGDAKW